MVLMYGKSPMYIVFICYEMHDITVESGIDIDVPIVEGSVEEEDNEFGFF